MARIAIAVSGDTARGLLLVKDLVGRSMGAAARWQDVSAPARWFMHHTILNIREHPIVCQTDPLLQYAAGKAIPYAAFLRALRKLPPQQIEAFILSHGERLDERQLAVAMDCSTTAAGNHLLAAEQMLKTVASDGYADRLVEFEKAYANLSPDEEQVRQYIAARVRSYTVPRKTVRWVKRAVIAVVILAIVYAAWWALVYMSV
jgi:DNA-directed RNA polymerase specialized sigma24 family protein